VVVGLVPLIVRSGDRAVERRDSQLLYAAPSHLVCNTTPDYRKGLSVVGLTVMVGVGPLIDCSFVQVIGLSNAVSGATGGFTGTYDHTNAHTAFICATESLGVYHQRPSSIPPHPRPTAQKACQLRYGLARGLRVCVCMFV
jgi:hypothetical protein